MNQPTPPSPAVRFDAAWEAALDHARQAAEDGWDVVLVRDLIGRVSLVVDDSDESRAGDPEALPSLAEAFTRDTRPFTAQNPVQTTAAMFIPEAVTQAPELAVLSERDPDRRAGRLAVLERTVVGADWTRTSVAASPAIDRRVALYGFKGGVGRSTATTVLARHLADEGRCVLVVDLDLESPGVSSLLQDPEQLPEYGIVDHLVEAAVGAADGLDLVVRSSVLPVKSNGEVWLAPAGGRPRDGYDFLAKMNRIYSDLPPAEPDGDARPFARRLDDAITACENRVTEKSRRPDIVLLDSRAGVHDIAAVTITQLSGLALLFAVDNPATWHGYAMLFRQWRDRPERVETLRERLRLVAAMLPQSKWEERLGLMREHAQEIFQEHLYDDEQGVGIDDFDHDAFNPPLEDEDAPHSPIPIFFSSDLVALDPTRDRDWIGLDVIQSAYTQFLDRVYRSLPAPLPPTESS